MTIQIPMQLFILVLLAMPLSHQQDVPPCKMPVEYGNRNDIDPEPLTIRKVSGRVMIQLLGEAEVLDPIPGACLGVFTDQDHKLIAGLVADENGGFKFEQIPTGQYRLVVRDPQNVFCVANIRIRVVKWPRGGILRGRQIVVHMQAAGIHTCSHADYK